MDFLKREKYLLVPTIHARSSDQSQSSLRARILPVLYTELYTRVGQFFESVKSSPYIPKGVAILKVKVVTFSKSGSTLPQVVFLSGLKDTPFPEVIS